MITFNRMGKMALRHPDLLRLKIRERVRTIQNMKAFKNNNRLSWPTNITFRVTQKCNLHCVMCPHYGKRGTLLNETKVNELTVEDIVNVVNDVSMYQPRVTISGDGEPFLNSDLFKMVAYIKANKIFCQIFTNGSFLGRRIDDALESGVDIITVSLDGPGEVHDTVRNKPGLFDKVVRGIGAIQERKKQKSTHKPIIAISTTIAHLNHHRISEMATIANGLGIEIINLNHLGVTNQKEIDATKRMLGVPVSTPWPVSEGLIGDFDGIDSDIVVKEIQKLYRDSRALIHQSPYLSEDKVRAYYSKSTFHLRKQCYAPWFRSHILPNGDVTPCFDYVIGNIREKNFNTIWHGEKMQRFRTVINKHGKLAFCDRKCCDKHYKLSKNSDRRDRPFI